MNRYLKYACIKAKDGKVIKLPSCCVACKKSKCPVDCGKWREAISDLECYQGEIEFAFIDDWWDVLCKMLIRISLIAVAGWLVYLFSETSKQKSEVSVERYFVDTAHGSELRIAYSGNSIDTNAVLTVVDKAANAMSKQNGGRRDR